MTTSQGSFPRHVFISYLTEDSDHVDQLQQSLEALGIEVWRDKDNLWPGHDWQQEIRKAIQAGSVAFIACFSSSLSLRDSSYQFEELVLAAEEYRKRPPGKTWLFTVRFDECELPDYNLGSGRNLNSVHRADLFGKNQTSNTVRFARAVQQVLEPAARSETIDASQARSREVAGPAVDQVREIKRLLRDPNGDIELTELVTALTKQAIAQLNDPASFPADSPAVETSIAYAEQIWRTMARYDEAIAPLLDLVRYGAAYGRPEHQLLWTTMMRGLATTMEQRSGRTYLLELRGYPVLVLMYVAVLAGRKNRNFGAIRAFVVDATVKRSEMKIPVIAYASSHTVIRDTWVASAVAMTANGEVQLTSELTDGLMNKTASGRHTPMSDYLCGALWSVFEQDYVERSDFEDDFDDAEVFMSLLSNDCARVGQRLFSSRTHLGRVTWRHVHSQRPPEAAMKEEALAAGTGWTPLLEGLFGGEVERVKVAFTNVEGSAEAFRRQQW